jgi:hypothetical protein
MRSCRLLRTGAAVGGSPSNTKMTRRSFETRDVKMSVFCLINQNPLYVLLGNESSIVHIGAASFVRLFTEIAIGESASILDKLSGF